MSNLFRDETSENTIQPKLEVAGAGFGSVPPRVTAIGLIEPGGGIDPTILTIDPPFWFGLIRKKVEAHFHQSFSEMEQTRAIQILGLIGLPPLCILVLVTRLDVVDHNELDDTDLNSIFESVGYKVTPSEKIINLVYLRSVFRLYRLFGMQSANMLREADLCEFKSSIPYREKQ